MTDVWSQRADAFRESPTHREGPDLDLLVEWCEPGAEVKVFDVATGGGHVARRLRERGCTVITVDPAPGMSPDVVSRAEELPFEDGSFDVVTCRIAPHHFEDIRKAVAEMARVTQRLVVIEDNVFVDEQVEEAERLRDPTHVRCYSEEEWKEMLTEAGLEVEQVEHFQRHPVVDDWLARVETPPEDGARVKELLADHIHDGALTLELDRRQSAQEPKVVAIIVDKNTRLLVQGLTGSEGRFHGLRNRHYGTNVVAGVTPGKAGQDVEGIPIFNTVADAVHETQANTTLIFVPARFATDAVYEAVDAGIETVICITEHIPAHEMLRVYTYLRGKGVTMIGPNCPGVLSPGKANVGIIPAEIFSEGSIGLVSRSGTLTYQIGHELTQLGLGNSTIVGIGGDPVVGSSFIDVLEKFEADPETELIVLVGEIGGDEEEKAARYVEDHVTKPVLAYIAGFSAPPGKTMGHAGAIISGSSGTAQAKKEALEAVGIQVGTTPTEVAQLVAGRFGARA